MDTKQIAEQFMEGYDCSQVVLRHFARELGISPSKLLCPYFKPIAISAPVYAPHTEPSCIPPPKHADTRLASSSLMPSSLAKCLRTT